MERTIGRFPEKQQSSTRFNRAVPSGVPDTDVSAGIWLSPVRGALAHFELPE
jgi:hypothetical protein